MKKVLLTTVMSLMMCFFGLSQTIYEGKKAPLPSEKKIGEVTIDIQTGGYNVYNRDNVCIESSECKTSEEEVFNRLLRKTKNEYGETYPQFELRDFKATKGRQKTSFSNGGYASDIYYYGTATVVIPDPLVEKEKKLSQAIIKALQDIKTGSRLALDQIKITGNVDKEDFKDRVVEILLDEGYRVVAKDYLEKLFEEQKAQQSGIFNERTIVQENNFSAVGYYINVRQTEIAIKVQVINVSTGEYEANVTVNF